ncbi:MAG: bifunctional folylpolyglutamate synthase/dihydrofolate synthase [Smithellaceae bacterium]|jgi:dihydrofolate synthase/folylpolyglutamate synthase|nr:bifunctional folylpolyglutamate synthase/dihydrofolate synthase [Smithellaceae bacterium]MDD3257853.1 bifunctional folylpolyglutamate synthase/dihydrofolate synthase [Smithellaceae bacterium]MDD3847803.1 bifunctional folylpolyglutamate synthase/dihydrofolate synthase [Smithellaceae bacterium]HPL10553.1 folylpolyglutamate synthase/dihydrofolate synthase family protein [Smithellaceae bacterium]
MNPLKPSAYLAGLNIDVMRFGLEAITGLLERFGFPQNEYPALLIAGTNGKGSTAAMAASILKEAGFRTGLYTSPHLVDVRERIALNGKKIPERDLGSILSEIQAKVCGPVSYFEALTAAAFIYFQRARVDIAVMEAGLGGRLDATNVCRPLVSVITNIGLEHTAYLGRTLTAVAGEKAGIIRQGGVCVTGATQQKVTDHLAFICRQKKSRFFRLGKDFKIIQRPDGRVDYCGIRRKISGLRVALAGAHQLANAALALAALEIVEEHGLKISDAAVVSGLKKTRWEARMEILRDRPVFLLDGAHNPSGVRTLCRALKKYFSRRRLILIFAVLSDKDYRAMLKKIAPLAAVTILPPLKTARAVPAQQLAREMKEMGFKAVAAKTVDEAIHTALGMAQESDVICALGSLYLAGEVKQSFHQLNSCGKA